MTVTGLVVFITFAMPVFSKTSPRSPQTSQIVLPFFVSTRWNLVILTSAVGSGFPSPNADGVRRTSPKAKIAATDTTTIHTDHTYLVVRIPVFLIAQSQDDVKRCRMVLYWFRRLSIEAILTSKKKDRAIMPVGRLERHAAGPVTATSIHGYVRTIAPWRSESGMHRRGIDITARG